MNLHTKMILLFLLLAIGPLLAIGSMAYSISRSAIEQNIDDHLVSTNTLRKRELERWLAGTQHSLQMLAQRPLVQIYAAGLSRNDPHAARFEGTRRQFLTDHLSPTLVGGEDYLEIFVLHPDTGRILVSTQAGQEGQYRGEGAYFQTGRQALTVQHIYATPAGPVMTIATPILAVDGSLAAVLAGHVDLAQMAAAMARSSGRLASEESYLVSHSGYLVTEPPLAGGARLWTTVGSAGITACLAGQSGSALYDDYRGVPVFGAYRWLPQWEVCLLTEVDQPEALAPILALRNRLVAAGIAVFLAAIAAAVVFTRTLTRPLQQLVDGAEEMGRGNLEHRTAVRSQDEIGRLSRTLDRMAGSLQKVTASRDDLDREIGERGRFEAELQASETRYRQLAETAHDVILTHGLDGRMTYANPAGLEILGYSRDELLAMHIQDLIAPGHHEEMAARRNRREAGEADVFVYEVEIVTRVGTQAPVEISSTLIQSGGRPAGVLVVARDIRERLRASRALQQERNLLRTVIDNLPDYIYVKDRQSRFIISNRAHLGLLGATSEAEIAGKTDLDLFPQALAEPYLADEQVVIETGRSLEAQEEITQHPVHGEQWLLTTKVPLWDENGTIQGIVGISRDITQRRQAEQTLQRNAQELARSNQELEQFAYVASHDLQEPLRMVTSYVQLLERRYRGRLDADADEFIHYAVDGAARMKRLINDLLRYSRVNTRGQPFAAVDCEEVLAQVTAALQIAIDESSASVTHDPLPVVTGDRSQLEQLFQNLVANAIKFQGEESPQVHLAAERREGEWLFSVQDNGVGIDPQYFQRIFIIFQRLHRLEQHPGTGIGLAICRKIVERHGGRIWVESEPGQGATFFFTIPEDESSGEKEVTL